MNISHSSSPLLFCGFGSVEMNSNAVCTGPLSAGSFCVCVHMGFYFFCEGSCRHTEPNLAWAREGMLALRSRGLVLTPPPDLGIF